MTVAAKVPDCYGHLYSERVEPCQACLLNSQCKEAMQKPKAALGTQYESEDDLPKDKKRLILAVCRKFGIPTSYYSKVHKQTFEATEENLKEFFNLDLLLTTKSALKKLLLAPLEEE